MSRFHLPEKEPEVDQNALRAFAAGAKEHRTAQPPPWEAYEPDALPRHNVSVRVNDYQLEMLRYLAGKDDVSQQKVMHRILIPVLKERAKKLYGN